MESKEKCAIEKYLKELEDILNSKFLGGRRAWK